MPETVLTMLAQRLNVPQIEDSLSRLPDVHAARVMLNDAGDDIEEIHVLATQSRNPKRLVRDIESLMYVQFHTRIDYRRVSLVQMSPQDLPSYFRRPKLVSVTQDSEDDALTVEVRLVHGDGVQAVGTAQAELDDADVSYAAARATLQAVTALIGDGGGPALEKVAITPFDGSDVALVYLSRQTAQGEEHLLGATFAEPDVVHGAVRATLDALNRRCF